MAFQSRFRPNDLLSLDSLISTCALVHIRLMVKTKTHPTVFILVPLSHVSPTDPVLTLPNHTDCTMGGLACHAMFGHKECSRVRAISSECGELSLLLPWSAKPSYSSYLLSFLPPTNPLGKRFIKCAHS